MKDIIERRFTDYICNTESHQDFTRRIDEIEERLKEIPNQDVMGLFIEYANLHFDFLGRHMADAFKQGFWVGCEIMREMTES